ncbi:hypothetical protein HPP92_013640 [Vanilla planifolia]|uniref:Uncharacterized protein n=1 Tax=Vanilla planifolia TaxID=51239 RepID=A0A835UZ80_VANPL|nr:hypothetical protein HPP92_014077 [Vanilla planifolia]KAG0478921.1 hypothetical protein HPP92_013640 [Vanilla planifolia]
MSTTRKQSVAFDQRHLSRWPDRNGRESSVKPDMRQIQCRWLSQRKISSDKACKTVVGDDCDLQRWAKSAGYERCCAVSVRSTGYEVGIIRGI